MSTGRVARVGVLEFEDLDERDLFLKTFFPERKSEPEPGLYKLKNELFYLGVIATRVSIYRSGC